MVIFKKVKWKNLLSTGNMFTEVLLNRKPATMITGKNGSGKSSILCAVTFSLFGKPYRNINKPQLLNSKNVRELLVEIEFTIGEDDYLVRRGIKPEVFEVYKDGHLQNQPGDSRDYQKTLNSILGFDYNTFIQVVIIGKTRYTPFMKLDSGKRRQFVETLLNLLVFTNMNKIHSVNMATHRDKMNELKSAIQVAGEKVTIRKKYISDLDREARASEAKSNAQTEERIAKLREEWYKVQDHIASLTQPESTKKSDAKALTKRIDQLKELVLKFRIKLDSMELQIRFMRENETCQTCGQPISEELKEKQCVTLSDKIFECEKARDAVTIDLTDAESRLAGLQEKERLYTEWAAEHEKLMTMLSMIDDQIGILQRDLDSSPISDIRSKIQEETVKLVDLQTVYERLLEKRGEMSEKSEYLNVIGVMLKDGGIKSMLIRRYITIINQAINSNLAKLGFFAKFTLNENFEETIQARGIDTLSYDNFSEGEKLRIDMAILMAWREVAKVQSGVSTNLLILDEIADNSMDSIGCDLLAPILTSQPNTNTFIITHHPDTWANYFHSHIIFEKVDGFSKIKIQ